MSTLQGNVIRAGNISLDRGIHHTKPEKRLVFLGWKRCLLFKTFKKPSEFEIMSITVSSYPVDMNEQKEWNMKNFTFRGWDIHISFARPYNKLTLSWASKKCSRNRWKTAIELMMIFRWQNMISFDNLESTQWIYSYRSTEILPNQDIAERNQTTKLIHITFCL